MTAATAAAAGRSRTARPLAWWLFAVTATLGLTQAVLFVSGSEPLASREHGLSSFPLITAGAVLGGLVGALVATRHPRNPIGWLFLVGQLGLAVGLASQAYSYRVLVDGDLGAARSGQVAELVADALDAQWTLSVLAAAFLLFPDGALLSRRWRPVLWAVPIPPLLLMIAIVQVPLDSVVYRDPLTNSGPLAQAAIVVSAVLGVLVLLLSAVSLVRRRRRARGLQRQQLRWLAVTATALFVGFALAQLDTVVWIVVPLFIAYASVPIAAGVAILRYRLYDIDMVINRAVVGSALVAFVTAGYVAVVVVLGALVGGRVSEQYWASALATAVVALAFQPIRSWVRVLGDRVVYGRRAAPYQTLAAFSRELAGSLSVHDILPVVADGVGVSLAAAQVTVRLELVGAEDVVVRWGRQSDVRPALDRVSVWHDTERLGEIAVSLPPGRALTAADRTLLADIAAQAGLGFRNAQLAASLQARIAEADRQANELEVSRRRLLAAQESQRQRLALAVRAEVLPHLARVSETLDAARADGTGNPTAISQALDVAGRQTEDALDTLREIARGVYPPSLARQGLVAALQAYASRHPDRASLTVSPAARAARPGAETQAVAYFCGIESLRELGAADIDLDIDGDRLILTVATRTPGGRLTDQGRPLVDRVEALHGSVQLEPDGTGRTRLQVQLPLDQPTALAHTASSRSGPNADLGT